MSSAGFTTFSALLLFFSLFITLCVFVYIFYAISSNIDEARSVRPPANVFVFGDFNVHHRDWLNSFDRTVKLSHNFLNIKCCNYSNDLIQTFNFSTLFSDCDSYNPALLDVFISSNPSVCSSVFFPSFRKLRSCYCFSFNQLCIKFKTRCPLSLRSL